MLDLYKEKCYINDHLYSRLMVDINDWNGLCYSSDTLVFHVCALALNAAAGVVVHP